ncbi:MAG: hypothetical protein HY549_08665 [Elusimicrobia bacterium]|nr:hypothetical protein [Elusimicrobiota bacterium]
MKTALIIALLGLACGRASAIRPAEESRRDAKRFGLDRQNEPGPSPSRARVREAIESFNSSRDGIIPSIFGRSRPPRSADENARRFLGRSRAAVGIDPAELSLERQTAGAGQNHVLYRQTFRGLPVEFARVKVHLDQSGSVLDLDSSYEQRIPLDINPSFPERDAARIVGQDCGIEPASPGQLVVFPEPRGGGIRLAWKHSVRKPGALWRYYVDAHTGRLLLRYNDLRMACASSGLVQGMVYDVDPIADGRPSQAPAQRRFNRQRVYIASDANVAETDSDPTQGSGFYCHTAATGRIFTQLQGSFVNVSNFAGRSLHHDNGGQWLTAAASLSSPNPYPADADLSATIDLSAIPSAVKVLPVFSAFNVGAITPGPPGFGSDVTDNDQVTLLDGSGRPIAAYLGNLGAFHGAGAPGRLLRLRLRSNSSGQQSGYSVSASSYLVLNAGTGDPNVLWVASRTASGLRSEINLFYHLNLMRDYFTGVDRSSQALANAPVNAIALVGPDILNAFYDPDYDNLLFGDGGVTPNDLFTDDATVPRHEYTHYVLEKIFSIQNFGQAGAISEAVADYFAASSLNRSSIAPFTNTGFTSPPSYTALRELDCPALTSCRVLTSSNWNGEIHDDSLFLSQALWEIRAAVGNGCADQMVFQSMLSFPESFQEFIRGMERAHSSISACGGSNFATQVNPRFTAHGLPLGAGTNDPYDTASEHNDGFETAVDATELGNISGTIHPAGDVDFFTFGAGAGMVTVTLNLPADGLYFKGYQLTLFDRQRRALSVTPTVFDGPNGNEVGLCGTSDCRISQARVQISYNASQANQYFVQIAGGPTEAGESNSGVNSATAYGLILDYPRTGALTAGVVNAAFDNDRIEFSVRVASFVRTQDYQFASAQLRDQSRLPVSRTLTHSPALSTDLMTVLSSTNALGEIRGTLSLVPGFASRLPSVGTVHLEVFATNTYGQTVSLGLSRPFNLSTAGTDLKAFNNVFNPRKGERAVIKYSVGSAGRASLRLYAINGAFVATLFDGDVSAGKGSVEWSGLNSTGQTVASGVYVVELKASGVRQTRKLAVVK